jgi:hypothetical protein
MDIYAIVNLGARVSMNRPGFPADPRPLSKTRPNRGGVSGVRTFFRHCPSCGRRFEIRVVSKKSVDSESNYADEKRPVDAALLVKPMPIMLNEDAPIIIDIEDFQYTYRCNHCGHGWSEIHETERKYDAPKGYTGD